jgi:hypothetical protein
MPVGLASIGGCFRGSVFRGKQGKSCGKTMMLSTTHYYGDLVRKLFLAGGLLMLISLPFFQFFVPVSMFVAIIAILVIILGAALIVRDLPC